MTAQQREQARKIHAEVDTVFADDQRDRRGCPASGEPVAPADDEPGVLAERAPRKVVLPTAAWYGGAKLSHGRRAAKCIEAAEDPDAEKQPRFGQLRGNLARCVDNARGNRISDGCGHAKPHAENSQQPSAARCRSGGRQRAGRQFSPLEMSISGSSKAAMITGRTEIASWYWSWREDAANRYEISYFRAECLRSSISPTRKTHAPEQNALARLS